MVKLVLISLLLLSACSRAPVKESNDSEMKPEPNEASQVQDCLTNPALNRSWGDCNVQKTVFTALPRLSECVHHANSGSYPENGELHFALKLKANGKVKTAKLLSGRTPNKALNICLQKELKKLQFAKPPKGAKAELTVPLALSDLK